MFCRLASMVFSVSRRNSLTGSISIRSSARPMMTFHPILMENTLICGMTFIRTPIPSWPISSAARIGMQSFTARTVHSMNSSSARLGMSFPMETPP